MRRRIRLTALFGVLAAGTLVFATATPASATQTPDLTCDRVYGSVYRLTANAEYTDSSATKLRTWKSFRFMVHGGRLDENHNNVNIRLTENGVVKFTYNSPDSLEFNRWYGTRPKSPVYTSIYGPSGEHDHRSNDVLQIEAIFDRPGISDPQCTATAKF